MNLDPETKKRIEENRLAAMRRREEVMQREIEKKIQTSVEKNQTSSSSRFTPYPPQKPQSNDILRNMSNSLEPSVPKSPIVSSGQVPKPLNQNPTPQQRNPWQPVIRQNFYGQRSTPYQQSRPTWNAGNAQNAQSRPQFNHPVNRHNLHQNNAKSTVTSSSVTGSPRNVINQQVTSSTLPQKKITIAIEVINENRFQVRLKPFDQAVIDEMRKINSKMWSPTTKLWSFAISEFRNFVSTLEAKFKNTLTIENKIPDFVLKILLRPSPVIDMNCLTNLDPKLLNTLMTFQKAGVAFGISRGGRVMICDDPGLGKTRQALGIANFYKDDGPVLIVTNASTREFWRDEILNVFTLRDKDVRIVPGYIEEAKYVICSYNALDSNIEELLCKKFGILIFDESHHIKNPKANQTKNAQKLSKVARRIIMLSGTPALSRPVELFPQLEMLDSSFATFHQYGVRYCRGHQTQFGFNTTGSSNEGELEILLKKRFLIRRIKSDVFDELENKNRECVMLQNLKFTEEEKENMNEFKSQMGDRIENASAKDQILIQWYHSTASLKAKAACIYIENMLKKTKEKLLCFAHHGVMMNAITAHLEKLKIGHIKIDGGTSGSMRSERIEAFQNNSNIRVAVLSTLAANAGITLTSGSIVIFCELEFNPSTIIQAEARAHRIGQKNQVKVFFLLAPGTADDVIWKMLMKKQSSLGKAGLVDTIEFLSNTIKISKFDLNAPDESSDEFEDAEEDTFVSCASTIDKSPIDKNQGKSFVKEENLRKSNDNDEFDMNEAELEELRRIEEEMANNIFD